MITVDWQLAKDLVTATRKGLLSLWTERIGLIYERAGGALSSINWNGSADIVAHEVVQDAARRMLNEKLRAALGEYVAEQATG